MRSESAVEYVAVDLLGEQDGMLEKCTELYCQIWKEPPWNEDFWRPEDVSKKILSVLARDGSVVHWAISEGQVAGFTWGFPVTSAELAEIAGHNELDHLWVRNSKVFYLAELGVSADFRGRKIGRRLTEGLIEDVYRAGFELIVLRTDQEAFLARRLYQGTGFTEIPVSDKKHPHRTYWLRALGV